MYMLNVLKGNLLVTDVFAACPNTFRYIQRDVNLNAIFIVELMEPNKFSEIRARIKREMGWELFQMQ